MSRRAPKILGNCLILHTFPAVKINRLTRLTCRHRLMGRCYSHFVSSRRIKRCGRVLAGRASPLREPGRLEEFAVILPHSSVVAQLAVAALYERRPRIVKRFSALIERRYSNQTAPLLRGAGSNLTVGSRGRSSGRRSLVPARRHCGATRVRAKSRAFTKPVGPGRKIPQSGCGPAGSYRFLTVGATPSESDFLPRQLF